MVTASLSFVKQPASTGEEQPGFTAAEAQRFEATLQQVLQSQEAVVQLLEASLPDSYDLQKTASETQVASSGLQVLDGAPPPAPSDTGARSESRAGLQYVCLRLFGSGVLADQKACLPTQVLHCRLQRHSARPPRRRHS
jgi:hypothetical protein